MVDSNDFDVDKTRWGITTGLVRTATITDPSGAEKDAGHTPGERPDAAAFNNRESEVYVGLRLALEDLFPQLEPWEGLLPGQPTLVITAGVGTVNVPSGRYFIDGSLVSVAGRAVPASTNSTGSTRFDSLVVEIDGNGDGTYEEVVGTTSPPTLAANQFLIAQYQVADGGNQPILIRNVVFQAAQRRPSRSDTWVVPASALVPNLGVGASNTTRLDVADCRMRFGASGQAVLPLAGLPLGSTVVAIIARLDPRAGNTAYGVTISYRYFDQDTSSIVTVNSDDNVGDALDANPSDLGFAMSHVLQENQAPFVLVEGAAANPLATDANAPAIRFVEVFYSLPS